MTVPCISNWMKLDSPLEALWQIFHLDDVIHAMWQSVIMTWIATVALAGKKMSEDIFFELEFTQPEQKLVLPLIRKLTCYAAVTLRSALVMVLRWQFRYLPKLFQHIII